MQCQHCGSALSANDRFCPSCGAKVEPRLAQAPTAGASRLCPSCGAPTDDLMNFCMHCGKRLPEAMPPVPAPAGRQGKAHAQAEETQGLPSQTVPSVPPAAYAPPAPLPGGVPPVQPDGDGPQQTNPNRKWIIIAIVVLIVFVAAGLGFWAWSANHADRQAGANPGSSQQAADPAKGADTSGGSDKRASDGDTDADKEGDESVKTCSASPDATLDSVNSSDATLVVKLHLDDSACGSMPYKESNVRVNLKDGAGDVVAAAVFDFAKKSIEFKDGEAEVSLAFNTQQYWRPVGQIDDGSSTSIVWQTNQKPDGKPAADAGSALGGANISADDRERFAQIALSDLLDHDHSAAYDFYDTYTNQLSSKKYNMELNGKTWKYVDIYEHFLKVKQKRPNALLIWASDYSNYTKHGHAADYYVILSGESFNNADEAQSWCSANGYTSDDCIAVDLQ